MKNLLLVFALLMTMVCCTTEADRNRMRANLDSINQRNRTDQPFTVQDVEPLVRFFDNHGTANDRLLAHYLLGRAYYEHGEAPMALECYHDAIDCADTTALDCDFAQLSRVYGQMANIFLGQGLHLEGIQSSDEAVKYAWKGKDTLAALRNYEMKVHSYSMMSMSDSVINICNKVQSLYIQYGYPSHAAIVLSYMLSTLIDIGELKKAEHNMAIYELKSGFFDSKGNIEHGREIYYKIKGRYYLRKGQLDSAEYYFRKEMQNGLDFNNQNAAATGLAELYQKLHRADSSAKYYQYAYAMNDSMFAHTAVGTIERMRAMYDYSHYQKKARKESERASKRDRQLFICILILLVVYIIATWLFLARKKLLDYLKAMTAELVQVKKELNKFEKDKSANLHSIQEKEKRIIQLENKLGRYGKLVYFGSAKAERDIKATLSYKRIKEMAIKGQKLENSEWDDLYNLIDEYFPGFHDFSVSHLTFGSNEYKICLLLRLHFKSGEIANMLGVSAPYISKVCSETQTKLFGSKGSSKELAKELDKIS